MFLCFVECRSTWTQPNLRLPEETKSQYKLQLKLTDFSEIRLEQKILKKKKEKETKKTKHKHVSISSEKQRIGSDPRKFVLVD